MRVFVLHFSAFSLLLLAAITPIAAQNLNHEAAVELVRQFKAQRNPYFQVDVAKKLVALGDSSVLPELEPYLNDEKRMVRGNAALVFAGLGDRRGFQIIVDILNDKSTNGHEIRGSTINPVRDDRYFAAHLLGDLKDPRAVPILIPLLKDPDVNYIVPWSLGEIGDKSAIPPLIETLGDKNPDMRALAIYALQAMNAKEALLRIRALVNDDQRIHFDGLGPVSQAAKEAIATLQEPPWASVEGKPVATRVITDTDNFATTIYYGECKLKYVVDGKEYLLWAAAYSFFEESVVRQKMSSCPESSFVVRYNPKDATDAIAVNPRR
jgi:hypothetical protein